MKIRVKIQKLVKKTIEVECPYYYKHNYSSNQLEDVVYVKIMPEYEITITETKCINGRVSYKIVKDIPGDSYLGEQYKSSKEEFEAAVTRALTFLTEC